MATGIIASLPAAALLVVAQRYVAAGVHQRRREGPDAARPPVTAPVPPRTRPRPHPTTRGDPLAVRVHPPPRTDCAGGTATRCCRSSPWGRDSVRVEPGCTAVLDRAAPAPWRSRPPRRACTVHVGEDRATLTNGPAADHRRRGRRPGHRGAHRHREELLREQPPHFWWPGGPALRGGRRRTPTAIAAALRAYDDERVHGLGQHGHGRFRQTRGPSPNSSSATAR